MGLRFTLIPIFLSGDKDPVGECGKGVIRAYNDFKKAGMESIDIRLYKELAFC